MAGAVVYSQTYNYYCWVNKRKQSINASIRILSTEYNERRLFVRSSCQTGIQTHTQTQLWVHIYACVFLHIHALAKREQDFCSISLSLQISLMSNLLTFGCSSHAGNLWRIVWANWFLRLRLDLPLHYVGTLFVTVLWVFPMPIFKYLFRMSNKPVSSSSGVSQYCRIYETRSSTIATLCKSLSCRLSSADSW